MSVSKKKKSKTRASKAKSKKKKRSHLTAIALFARRLKRDAVSFLQRGPLAHGVRRQGRRTHYNDRWAIFAWAMPALLVVLALAAVLKPKAQYPINLTSAKLIGLFQRAQVQPVGDRIAFWSEKILRDPAILAPLGAGPEINDTAPLFPHGYDCTTFVETVGALSRSDDGNELADQLIKIRYRGGKISYETRNHFPEADWIPNNERAGVLDDITVKVAHKAGFVAGFAHKEIDKVAWFKAQKNEHATRAIANVDSDPITVKLPYLPADKVMSALQHIPQGAVINIVRESKDRYPVLISHQGFLIWKNGVAYLRHASRNKEISEVPFEHYLRQARAMPWKVLGFNVDAFRG